MTDLAGTPCCRLEREEPRRRLEAVAEKLALAVRIEEKARKRRGE